MNETIPTIQTTPKVIDTTQAEATARAQQLAKLAKNENHPEKYIQIATEQVIAQKYGTKK